MINAISLRAFERKSGNQKTEKVYAPMLSPTALNVHILLVTNYNKQREISQSSLANTKILPILEALRQLKAQGGIFEHLCPPLNETD